MYKNVFIFVSVLSFIMFSEVLLKNKKDFPTSQYFSWRYTPTSGLPYDVPDEPPRCEGMV